MADGLTFTPTKQPDTGLKFTKFSSDGSAAVRSVFPNAVITSGHRTNGVGSPYDDHHLSNGAVDVAPIKGMTFDQFVRKLKSAGYPVIQAIDEVNHPSKWSTGPHWHVALGEHPSGLSFTPTQKPDKAPQKALSFTPVNHTTPAPKPSPRPANQAPAADPSLISSLETGAGNALHSVWDTVRHPIASAESAAKAGYQAIRHPGETLKNVVEPVAGVGMAAMDAASRKLEGHDFATGPHAKALAEQYRPWVDKPWSQFKKEVREHPIATAATVIPGGRMLGKLGARGVEAARLASLSPEERAAWRARRAEEAKQAEAYRAIQRQTVGRHSLDRDRAIATLQKHQRVIGNAPVADQRSIVAAIEAGPRAIAKLPEQYRPAAMDLRKVAKTYRAKIEDVMKKDKDAGPNFIDNYYAHLWKQDGKAKAFFSGKQGHGANLKGRKFATLAEGLEHGLTPIHENPLDQMSAYVDNMSKFLQAHDIQRHMRSAGLAKWVPERAIPDNHIKLEGINTTREARTIPGSVENDTLDRQLGRRVLVAPRKAALMYNRFVDPGAEAKLRRAGKTEQANAFRFAKRATNATSNLVLSFSGFHPTLVAGKAVASDLGNAITHTFRGEPVKALKNIAHAPIAPIAPVIDKLRGKISMKGRLLSGDQALTQVDKLWRDAGGRLKNDSGYRASLRPNLWTSFRRGTFKRDVTDMAKAIAGKDKHWTERVSATADAAGRIMDTMSSAIFDHFVPAMKRQAFEREMAAQLKPGMSEAAQKALARRVMDNISGRMGELERDNIFWSQTRSDIMRLLVLSPSWQYGDWKLLTDAAGPNRTGHGLAQAAAIVGSYYLMNGIANYLHTGERPQGQDWIAYRTGGTTSDRTGEHPERATFPSVMKDVFSFSDDPVKEAENKQAPLPRAIEELLTNSDWRDQPIYRPSALSPEELPAGAPDNLKENRGLAALGHLAGSFLPIGTQDNPNGKHSGISRTEQILLGTRPAGQRFYDPEGYESFQKYAAKKRVEAEIKAKRRDDAKKNQ